MTRGIALGSSGTSIFVPLSLSPSLFSIFRPFYFYIKETQVLLIDDNFVATPFQAPSRKWMPPTSAPSKCSAINTCVKN